MSEGTTQLIRRRVRHWKTTIAGIALMAAPVACAIWPDHAGTINNIAFALGGAGFMAAADSSKTDRAGLLDAVASAVPFTKRP